jgi:hypothetical protein
MVGDKPTTGEPGKAHNPAPTTGGESETGFNENRYFSAKFAKQIRTQRTNLMIAAGFTLGVLCVSLVSTWYLFRTGMTGAPLEYMKLGPVAISGIALPFPLRMCLSYRVRIPIYEGYQRLFDEAASKGQSVERHLVEDARDALKALHKLD